MDKIIELQDVSYQYPHAGTKSLERINLTVERGKMIAVMGPTGAGKTTLSLCLNGLIPQLLGGRRTGKIRVAGRDVDQYRVQTLGRHIGLVLQDPETQIFGNTVAADTAFGLCNFLVPPAEIDHRVSESLQRVRLQGYQNRDTAELSGGEKQRLAIAGVLALAPEILVLDEPASELDPLGRTELYQTIADLRRENNVTLVLMEHSGEAVIAQADSVIVLCRGEIVWQGAPVKLFRDIPRLLQFGIKPLPVSQVGWGFYQKGWITREEIPLRIPEAESLIRNLLARYGTGRFVNPPNPPAVVSETSESPPSVLEIADLRYEYPNSAGQGLHGVNLTVSRGEFVALIGPNGAGKTTLAKHLNGLLQPGGGSVIVNGMNTKEYDTSRLAQVVGYVFQNPDHQIFEPTVEQELAYGLQNLHRQGHSRLGEAEIKARIDQALQWVGLEPQRHAHPFTLGKGQRQLVALASILVLQPEILVIDEPTTGLDWTGAQKMMALIERLHQAGTTVLMITHDMDLVARHARRIVVLKDGAILRDGSPREVLADCAALEQACIVPPQIVSLSARLRDIGLSETLLQEQDIIKAVLQATEGSPWR